MPSSVYESLPFGVCNSEQPKYIVTKRFRGENVFSVSVEGRRGRHAALGTGHRLSLAPRLEPPAPSASLVLCVK